MDPLLKHRTPLYDLLVKKPQFNNEELEKSIIRLNFSEPHSWTKVHPFWESIRNWNPPKNVDKGRDRHESQSYAISNIITEVNDELQFDEMINHLKEKTEWAVDLEHNDSSYLGITCLIQISTTEKNFLIDPFDLNMKIKEDLKPLMESAKYLKVFHGCYNDLRWLQRDYNIYAWPVIDTQVMYKKIGAIKKYSDCDNHISLVKFIGRYLPSVELQKDLTLSDFLKRPLTLEQKMYAIQDTMLLLPALCEMKKDLGASNTNITFESIMKFSAEYLAKKILYEKKEFPSVEEEIENFKLKPKEIPAFKCLHAWRDDKAKVLDVHPNTIIFAGYLAGMGRLENPSINSIEKYASSGDTFCKTDFLKIKEIIDNCQYKRLTLVEALQPCSNCDEYYHPVSFWPGRIQNCDSFGKVYVADWQNELHSAEEPAPVPETNKVENDDEFDPSDLTPESINFLSRMLRVVNKEPYSKTGQIGRYPFLFRDVQYYTNNLKKGFIEKMFAILKCTICKRNVQKALVFKCDCGVNPIICKECWKSRCPLCQTFKPNSFPFEPVDTILRQGQIFLNTCWGNNTAKIFGALVTCIKNTEMELMCNYCFGPLETTIALQCGKKKPFTSQCCKGCDELYIENYGSLQDPVPLKQFDTIIEYFNSYIAFIAGYFEEHKQSLPQTDTPVEFGKQSFFKEKGLERLAKRKD